MVWPSAPALSTDLGYGGRHMRHLLVSGMIILVSLCSGAEDRDWEWVSGGNFNSIAVQNGGSGDPTGHLVWLSGNLLVKGVRHETGWSWSQVAPELTEDSWVSSLVFSDDGSYAMLRTMDGVAHSANGGTTWNVHLYPDWIEYLVSFQITAPSQVYAVGRHTDGRAILVQTGDGGTSWDLIYDSGEWPGNFLDLHISGDGHATLVGNYYSGWFGWLGVIVETDDDFESVSRTDYDDQALWALEAPSPEDRYALGGPDLPGSQRPIFVSLHGEDGAWAPSTLPGDIFQIADMTFDSALHGWVVGHFEDAEVGSGGVLLETANGGESWTRTDFCFNCVSALPMVEEPLVLPDSVALVGDDLFVAQSAGGWPCTSGMCTGLVMVEDGIGQWDRIDRLTGFTYVDIDLAQGALEGIAVGFDGHPWRSFTRTLANGTWQDPEFHLVDCSFLGSCPPLWSEVHITGDSEVWASARVSTEPAQVMKSLDGGSSWSFVDTGETSSLAAPILSVASASSIWAAMTTSGNANTIIGTDDHGSSWQTIQDGGIYPYTHLDHIDEMQYCFVVRSMACTKDGGVHWSYPVGPTENTGLQLLDLEYGWTVGFGQQGGLDVYKTTDGGTTWSKLTTLDAIPIRYPSQMQFVSRLEGWLAVRPNGGGAGSSNLLKTGDGGVNWAPALDGVYLDDEIEGLVYEVAADGSGWLASRFSGTLLKTKALATVFSDGFENGDCTNWSSWVPFP